MNDLTEVDEHWLKGVAAAVREPLIENFALREGHRMSLTLRATSAMLHCSAHCCTGGGVAAAIALNEDLLAEEVAIANSLGRVTLRHRLSILVPLDDTLP